MPHFKAVAPHVRLDGPSAEVAPEPTSRPARPRRGTRERPLFGLIVNQPLVPLPAAHQTGTLCPREVRMQQLTVLDSMFTAMDTDTTNAILGGLILFEPSPDGRTAPDEDFMRVRISERAKYLPPLTRRLVKAPLGMGHDYLAEYDRLDVASHLRTMTLPAPGTHEQLAEEVSRQMSAAKLPDDRPLWDYTVIKGLQDGSVAHLLRIHHVVIDGGSMPVLWDLLSDHPKEPLTVATSPFPEPRFGPPEVALHEFVNTALAPAEVARLTVDFGGWAVKTIRNHGLLSFAATPLRMIPGDFTRPLVGLVNRGLRKQRAPEVSPWMPAMRAPDMPFTGRVSPRRKYVFAALPLEDFRRIGKLLGGTINDAVLGVTAGAMRRYLIDRHLPVDGPLIVNIPISLRTGQEKVKWANYVLMIFAEFPVHLADPVQRVRSASRSVKKSRASFQAMPVSMLPQLSKLMHPLAMRVPMQLMARAPHQMQKIHYNVVVSNVRGPVEPVYWDGVEVKGYWPASFLALGGGINITLQSYADKMCFGFMSTPEQGLGLEKLVDYMALSLQETLEAAQTEASGPPGKERVPRRRRSAGTVTPLAPVDEAKEG